MAVSFSFLCQLRGVRVSDGWPRVRDGLALDLFRESENAFDVQAIVARRNGVAFGHIAKEAAAILSPLLDCKRIMTKGYIGYLTCHFCNKVCVN